MMVIILQNAPPRLRGELTRWLLEPAHGVYIGHVTALVRERLWEKCCQNCPEGGVFQAWNTNNEQRFAMRVHGDMKREVEDFEGLQLIVQKE